MPSSLVPPQTSSVEIPISIELFAYATVCEFASHDREKGRTLVQGKGISLE